MDSHSSESDLEEMILDLNPSLSQQFSASQKRVPLVERVCDYMAKQNTDTKAFLLAYLQSKNDKIVRRKKQWGSVGQGWKSTEAVLDAIDNLVNQKPECRPKWNDWILKKVLLSMFCQDVDNYTYNWSMGDLQAKVIVANQSPPQGSLYINTNKLDAACFDHKNDLKREEIAIKSMNFLHELILSKLEHGHQAREAERERREKNKDASESESD